MISSIKKTNTKKPSRNGHTKYANFDFEDVRGTVRCIMWPEDYSRLGENVKTEAICFIEGRVDRRGREPNVVVNNLITIDEASRKFTDQVAIKFQRGLHGEGEIDRAGEILRRHPGRCGVVIVIESFDDDNPSLKLRYLLAPASTSSRESHGSTVQAPSICFFLNMVSWSGLRRSYRMDESRSVMDVFSPRVTGSLCAASPSHRTRHKVRPWITFCSMRRTGAW
jgi:hypothetical protein